MDLMLDLAGMRFDLPRKRTVNQPLRKQDVVEQDVRIALWLHEILKAYAPPEVTREVEQRVVQEPPSPENVSLKIRNQVEEEKVLFEVFLARSVVQVPHDEDRRIGNLLELSVDVRPNIYCLCRHLDSRRQCLAYILFALCARGPPHALALVDKLAFEVQAHKLDAQAVPVEHEPLGMPEMLVATLFKLAPEVNFPRATRERIPGCNRKKRSLVFVLLVYQEPDPLVALGCVLSIGGFHRDPLSPQQGVRDSVYTFSPLGPSNRHRTSGDSFCISRTTAFLRCRSSSSRLSVLRRSR